MDNQNRIDEIKKKVSRTSLYISRIPDKSKTEFKKIATEEFEGDYGMCIKWLLDFRNGLLANPNQILSDKIDVLADQISFLQGQINTKEKDSEIKLVSGKKLKRRNENVETSSPSGQKPNI